MFFMKPTPDYPQIVGLEHTNSIVPFLEFQLPAPPLAMQMDSSGVVMQGYPYVFEYVKPLELPSLPTRADVSINPGIGYITKMENLSVKYNDVSGIMNNDEFVAQIYDRTAMCYEQRAGLSAGDININVTINASVLEGLGKGRYTVKAFIQRGSEKHCEFDFMFTIAGLPSLTVNALVPDAVQKPINDNNQNLTIDYSVNSYEDCVQQVSSTFMIENYTATNTINRERVFSPIGTANSSGRDFSFTFNVTDPDFRLRSFAFRIALTGNVNLHIPMTYTIDGIEVMSGIFLANAFLTNGLLRFTPPEPMTLALGSHTIRLFNHVPTNTFNWIMRSLTAIPTVPGFTITSTPIFESEMVYSLSTDISESNSITLAIDNSIPDGEHFINGESIARLEYLGEYAFAADVQDLTLRVDGGLLTLGRVELAKSARYLGAGIDNDITINGLEGIEDGDELRVRISLGENEYYNATEILSDGITSYVHTVPAEIFNSQMTAEGAYTVAVSISRGDFMDEAILTYAVVPIPIVSLTGLSTDRIELPAASPMPLTIGWEVISNEGNIDFIEGSAIIANAAFTEVDVFQSEEIGSYQMSFDSLFPDIYGIHNGLYDVRIMINVISHDFGTVTVAETLTHAFTAFFDGIPGISLVKLNYAGRYVGAEMDIHTAVRLFNIDTGDQIRYELRNNSDAVIYSTSEELSNGAYFHYNVIPSEIIKSLPIGAYRIVVITLRDGSQRKIIETNYTVHKPPTLHFVSVEPDVVEYPIESPTTVNVHWYVNGTGIDSIEGSFGIVGTEYEASVDIQKE